MYTYDFVQPSSAHSTALHISLHCVQMALCAALCCQQNCTVYKAAVYPKVAPCTAHKPASCRSLHGVEHFFAATVHCFEKCTAYKSSLRTKWIYVGCGHFASPGLSYSHSSTLPEPSTHASATQLTTAWVSCSTGPCPEQVIDCKPIAPVYTLQSRHIQTELDNSQLF